MRRLSLFLAASAAALGLLVCCSQTPQDLPPPLPPPPRAAHVVLISIDGLRPDALEATPTPNLRALIAQGTYCPDAMTGRPSITLPSHASMLTGLDCAHHGVDFNNYRPGHIRHPTVFSVAKAAGLRTAMYFSKDKFCFFAQPGVLDLVHGIGKSDGLRQGEVSAAGIAAAFTEDWKAKPFGLVFLHLKEPDEAGHAEGWMSPTYLAGVRAADAAVGTVLKALDDSGEAGRTAVIITSDHGGKDKHHKLPLPENLRIPWICRGPGVPKGVVLSRQVLIADTAPTVLAFLGLSFQEPVQGIPVREVLGE